MAIRALGRIDAPLPQAHRREAVQVPALRPMLLPQRPPSSPHEETRVINRLRGRSRSRVTLRGRDRRDFFLVKIAGIFDVRAGDSRDPVSSGVTSSMPQVEEDRPYRVSTLDEQPSRPQRSTKVASSGRRCRRRETPDSVSARIRPLEVDRCREDR